MRAQSGRMQPHRQASSTRVQPHRQAAPRWPWDDHGMTMARVPLPRHCAPPLTASLLRHAHMAAAGRG